MNGAKRIEERPAAPAPTQFRKAPEIKTDYNTMPDDLRRALLTGGERERTRPWAILLGAGVFFAALWLTAFALNADLPAWTEIPTLVTGITVMVVGGAFTVAGLVGW